MLPWMEKARGEIGQVEIAGPVDNPRVVMYHASTATGPAPDDLPWCSSFVNWSLQECQIVGTRSKASLSWRTWGDASPPGLGAIGVIDRGGGKGHVGFVAGYDEKWRIVLLAGNQNNAVNLTAVDFAKFIGFRIPKGFKAEPMSCVIPTNVGGSTR